jgi:hypothetical protein
VQSTAGNTFALKQNPAIYLLDSQERMFYNRGMDAEAKLELLADNAAFEPAEEKRGEAPSANAVAACGHSPLELKRAYEQIQAGSASTLETKKNSLGIRHAVMPGGKPSPAQTMLTSACERDCYYCPFRAGRDFRRATFKPDEMAKTFNELQRSRIAEGLFPFRHRGRRAHAGQTDRRDRRAAESVELSRLRALEDHARHGARSSLSGDAAVRSDLDQP